MKHLFVPLEIAEQLKDEGFDEECFGTYRFEMDGSVQFFTQNPDELGSNNSDNADWVICTVPLYQQVIDFFHSNNIHIEIYYNHSGCGYILTKMNGTTIKEIEDEIFFEDYYKAMDVAITEALKLI